MRCSMTGGLLHGAKHIAAHHVVAHLGGGNEVPLLLVVNGGYLNASLVVLPQRSMIFSSGR